MMSPTHVTRASVKWGTCAANSSISFIESLPSPSLAAAPQTDATCVSMMGFWRSFLRNGSADTRPCRTRLNYTRTLPSDQRQSNPENSKWLRLFRGRLRVPLRRLELPFVLPETVFQLRKELQSVLSQNLLADMQRMFFRQVTPVDLFRERLG